MDKFECETNCDNIFHLPQDCLVIISWPIDQNLPIFRLLYLLNTLNLVFLNSLFLPLTSDGVTWIGQEYETIAVLTHQLFLKRKFQQPNLPEVELIHPHSQNQWFLLLPRSLQGYLNLENSMSLPLVVYIYRSIDRSIYLSIYITGTICFFLLVLCLQHRKQEHFILCSFAQWGRDYIKMNPYEPPCVFFFNQLSSW